MKIALKKETVETSSGLLIRYWVELDGGRIRGSETLYEKNAEDYYERLKSEYRNQSGIVTLKSEDI